MVRHQKHHKRRTRYGKQRIINKYAPIRHTLELADLRLGGTLFSCSFRESNSITAHKLQNSPNSEHLFSIISFHRNVHRRFPFKDFHSPLSLTENENRLSLDLLSRRWPIDGRVVEIQLLFNWVRSWFVTHSHENTTGHFNAFDDDEKKAHTSIVFVGTRH